MEARNVPPGRTSMSQRSVTKPCGPHQRAARSGSVQALNTSRRGASKMRVITSSRSVDPGASAAMLVLASICVLLRLQFVEILIQPIEALFPMPAVMFEPLGGILERTRIEPAGPPLRLAPARDQAGALQHLQVLGDPRKRHVKRLRQLGHRGFAPGKPRQNRPPGGVGESGKREAELIGHHLYNTDRLIN